MKRSFTGPVWLLLVIGLVQGWFAWGTLQLISELYIRPGATKSISMLMIVYTLMWPVILLLEAMTYWLIRRRNKMKLPSWTHAAFLQVLILAFRKPDLMTKEGDSAENILDDVIL